MERDIRHHVDGALDAVDVLRLVDIQHDDLREDPHEDLDIIAPRQPHAQRRTVLDAVGAQGAIVLHQQLVVQEQADLLIGSARKCLIPHVAGVTPHLELVPDLALHVLDGVRREDVQVNGGLLAEEAVVDDDLAAGGG
eukprot:4338074-Heterocapsa_arctica.AAC.1